MKASELIKELESKIKEDGDHDIRVPSYNYEGDYRHFPINEMIFDKVCLVFFLLTDSVNILFDE